MRTDIFHSVTVIFYMETTIVLAEIGFTSFVQLSQDKEFSNLFYHFISSQETIWFNRKDTHSEPEDLRLTDMVKSSNKRFLFSFLQNNGKLFCNNLQIKFTL